MLPCIAGIGRVVRVAGKGPAKGERAVPLVRLKVDDLPPDRLTPNLKVCRLRITEKFAAD